MYVCKHEYNLTDYSKNTLKISNVYYSHLYQLHAKNTYKTNVCFRISVNLCTSLLKKGCIYTTVISIETNWNDEKLQICFQIK